ncbi:MAG: hypothetical protein ACLSA6_04345 [Holdemania massiliensis]
MEQGADVLMFSAGSQPYSRGGSNHAVGSKYQKRRELIIHQRLPGKSLKPNRLPALISWIKRNGNAGSTTVLNL